MNLDNSGDCLQIFDAATANPSVPSSLQFFMLRVTKKLYSMEGIPEIPLPNFIAEGREGGLFEIVERWR
jgi:hypothetical protein